MVTQLICKKIDDTDYYYFAEPPDRFLFALYCDEMDVFVGKEAYDEIHDITENGGEAKLTIAVSVQPGG